MTDQAQTGENMNVSEHEHTRAPADLRRHRTRVIVFSMLLGWLALVVIVVALVG
jgi:hypothetical protein